MDLLVYVVECDVAADTARLDKLKGERHRCSHLLCSDNAFTSCGTEKSVLSVQLTGYIT